MEKRSDSEFKLSAYDKLLHRSKTRIDNRGASILFRQHIIESQNRINYRHEFDRLHGVYYQNPNLPAPTKKSRIYKTFARISNKFINSTRYYRSC